jgi:hypothetical protein
MSAPDKSLVTRRDELMEIIIGVLECQLHLAPLTVEQHIALQKAIAHYTEEIIAVAMEIEKSIQQV